jgi:hypothetical protein
MRACRESAELARFVDGEFTENERHGLEAHLPGCARCRSLVGELRAITADLARDPAPEMPDLAPLVLARAALPPRRRPWLRPAATAVSLAAAAAAGLVAGVAMQHQRAAAVDESGFQARGGGDSPDRWVAVHPYVLDGAGALRPRPLAPGSSVENCGARLLFSYDNGGPHPYRYLMIAGVGDDGRITWFFPEGRPGDRSIAVEPGVGRELHEEIGVQHTGHLAIHGLFSHAPLAVDEVARMLASRDRPGALADTGRHRVDLHFSPCARE